MQHPKLVLTATTNGILNTKTYIWVGYRYLIEYNHEYSMANKQNTCFMLPATNPKKSNRIVAWISINRVVIRKMIVLM